MTQSLTERLQERQAAQMAEIEALTSAELKRLGESLRRASEAELRSTQDAIREMQASWSSQLESVNVIARWWWVALIVTWLAIGGLSVWHSMRPGQPPVQTFTSEGRTYLVPPAGAEATTCTRGEQRFLCVRLPEGI